MKTYFLQAPVVCNVHAQLNHSRGFQESSIWGIRKVAAESVFLEKRNH